MWFSAQISNYAEIPWNTQKTPIKHVLRLFKEILKIRFSAQTSGSRLRCRTMLKYIETQKTPTKHAFRHLKNFLKIRFLAEKSGSRLRCRIMLKIPWNSHTVGQRKKVTAVTFFRCPTVSQKTPTKHVLRLFEKFLKIWFSAKKNPVLCFRCRTMLKIPWNTQKTPPKHVLILNNLQAMVRCLGQPTQFIILQMICTDQNWGSC